MIARQNHALHIVFSVSLLLANIVCFNVLFGRVRGARVDLTEGKIYTLAPQTRELLQEPEEPLEIFFYHTALDRLHEKLRPLVGPLGDILKEFAAASNGKVTARIVEWDTADKATQDRASEQFGVKGVGIQMQTSDEETVRNTYFSVVVAYGDQFQKFDQADLYRIVQVGAGLDIRVELQNIEYLLAKAIYKVVRGFQSIGAALATHDMDARIDLYFSPTDQLPEFLKKVPGYANKVAKKLADEAMGRLKFEAHEVADADDALKKKLRTEWGIRAIQTDIFSEKGIYSYAVIGAGKQVAPVPLVTLGEEMSEFEVRDAIEGALKSLVPGFLMTIGVMSPDAGKNNQMAQMMGQRPPPEEFREVVQALEAEFDVRRLDVADGKPIPRQVAVLVLIRPENYSDKAIYEIDQFLMRGGRLVVCADAMSLDLERALQARQQNTLKQVDMGGFKTFLRHMGADVGEGAILDTKSEVVRMMEQVGRRGEIRFFDLKLPYFAYIEPPDGFDQTHDIVAKQRFLLLEWATSVSPAKAEPASEGKEAQPGVPAGVEAREIAWTSKESSISKDVAQAKAQMTAGFEYAPPKDATRYPVVLVLNGVFPSYFAGKPIPGTEKAAESRGTDTAASRASEDRERGVRLDKSKETSIVVIGDSDFVSPIVAQWFGVEKSLSRNVAFLRNAIDFGGPEAKLMAIRNRENVQRPLTALRSYDEEQRQTKTAMSRWLALAVPCGLLLLFGAAWAIMRHNRRPIDLPTGRHSTSRVTS